MFNPSPLTPYLKKQLPQTAPEITYTHFGFPSTACDHTFHNSEILPPNKSAFTTASNFVLHHVSGNFYQPNLFIYGSSRSGKSYLAECIANELIKYDVQFSFIQENDLFDRLLFAKNNPHFLLEEALMCYKTTPVLILDDFGSSLHYPCRDEDRCEASNWRIDLPWRLSILDELFAFRHKYRLPSIVTSQLFNPNFPFSDSFPISSDKVMANSLNSHFTSHTEHCHLCP